MSTVSKPNPGTNTTISTDLLVTAGAIDLIATSQAVDVHPKSTEPTNATVTLTANPAVSDAHVNTTLPNCTYSTGNATLGALTYTCTVVPRDATAGVTFATMSSHGEVQWVGVVYACRKVVLTCMYAHTCSSELQSTQRNRHTLMLLC